MILFNRTRNSTARMLDDNILLITSSLLDSMHEMELSIRVDLKDRTILDADFEMKRAPYTFCFDVADRAAGLKGFNVFEWNKVKRLYQALAGRDGCLQLADLAVEGIKIVNPSILATMYGGRAEMLKTFDRMLQGTCYSHSRPPEEKIKAAYSLVPGRLDAS